MSFDLRIPIGLMFTLFGLVLVGFGLLGPQDVYKQSLGINVNLWWGLAQLCFGVLMLFFGLRPKKSAVPPEEH